MEAMRQNDSGQKQQMRFVSCSSLFFIFIFHQGWQLFFYHQPFVSFSWVQYVTVDLC
jgi:hypothetical protein